MPDPRAGLDEDGDRRDGEHTDRRHEIEMRPLAPRHPKHKLGQVQRVALVLLQVEGALQEWHPAKNDDREGEEGRESGGPGSAHSCLFSGIVSFFWPQYLGKVAL